MPAARRFTELLFWQRAGQWSKRIFERSKQEPFCRDQRLVVQINDSSESVMSNMAEGFGCGTQEEFITFLGYALGSLDETQSHFCAAYDRQYLAKDEFAALYREGTSIRKLTVAFIQRWSFPEVVSARGEKFRVGQVRSGKSTSGSPAGRDQSHSRARRLMASQIERLP